MARAQLAILGTVVLLLAWSQVNAAPATPIVPLEQPKWSELTPQQQQILAPLAKDWDGTESYRRKKWLGIAQRYPSMTPEQQQRVRTQMKPWASLTPEERNAARANFKKQNRETPEQREARRKKWEQYNALPEAEKKKFREKAAKSNQAKRGGGHAAASRPLTRPAPSVIPSLSGTAAAK